MKTPTFKVSLLVAMLLICFNAFAYDIQIDNIYYYVNVNDFTCEVTFKDNNYNSYSGDIVIPETVTYKTKTLHVTSIGYNAFYNCADLTSVTIGNSVTTIKDNAFYNCSGLEKLIIPNSVTRIDGYAFSGCSSLKELILEDGTNSLSLGYCPYTYTNNGWMTNQSCGLFYHTPIENVYIGRDISCEHSPFYDTLTGGNPNIKSVTFGNTVTKIRYNTFYKCSNLTSITIGNSVNIIEDGAFEGCPNVVSIYLEGTIPPIVGDDNFTKSHYMDATVYVPQGSLSTYQSADIWKEFWDIQELSATDEPDTETKKCAMPVISYENGALTITSATEGANFITEIRNSDVAMHYDSRIELTVTYDINTYATLAGYENSDIAMATLCWIDEEGIASDLTRIESTPVIIKSYNGNILLDGAKAGTEIVVYDINGINMSEAVADGNEVVINTSLSKNDIAIVHIGNKAVKIIMQ